MIKDYASAKERLNFEEDNQLKITVYHDIAMVLIIILMIAMYILEGKIQ